MIVLVGSHRQERAQRRVPLGALDAGARWGKAAEFGVARSAGAVETGRRGGVNQVDTAPRHIVKIWNLSPVWRAFDMVEIESSEDPSLTVEATVTRQMLVPVELEVQNYVGGGIGYVEDPGDYGFQPRMIHTFVLLTLPSPVPEAPVIDQGEEGEWPAYPEEMFLPGQFAALGPLPGPWTR